MWWHVPGGLLYGVLLCLPGLVVVVWATTEVRTPHPSRRWAAVAMLVGNPVQLNHYANLLALVVINAVLVLAALLANASCQWWSLHLVRTDLSRPGPWVQEGVAVADSGVIAWCEDRGPLLGVTYHVQSFRLRTASGIPF